MNDWRVLIRIIYIGIVILVLIVFFLVYLILSGGIPCTC
jgi:hypothetical protein